VKIRKDSVEYLLICYNKLINIKEREFGYDSGNDTIIAAGFNAGGDFHNAVAASADTAAAGTRTGS
ncbi:hypothetical protein, partial [Phascolarctobacterium faecium]|uniref:hypothetical protein n=1 Tax=Phascolarctobacterium faecium TaxID=33025 RepID=UPI003AB3149F